MALATFSKRFKKNYERLPRDIQLKFHERIDLFVENYHAPVLNRHRLKGKFAGFESINVTGDYRAIFEWKDFNHAEFIRIGTHSQLYK